MMGRAQILFRGRCPCCRSIDFRSVGVRNVVEGALYWIVQPCRCSLCGRHFFLFRWLVPASAMA
jgi:hypothetical protein